MSDAPRLSKQVAGFVGDVPVYYNANGCGYVVHGIEHGLWRDAVKAAAA
jgi:hypothetical protein